MPILHCRALFGVELKDIPEADLKEKWFGEDADGGRGHLQRRTGSVSVEGREEHLAQDRLRVTGAASPEDADGYLDMGTEDEKAATRSRIAAARAAAAAGLSGGR